MSKLKLLLQKHYNTWATRSLAVGLVATAVDLSVGNALVFLLHFTTALSAICALAVASTVNFLLQRRYAFNEKKVATPAWKWALMTAIQEIPGPGDPDGQ